jgi:hypothetical protein
MALATPGILPVKVTIADFEPATVAVFAVLRITAPPRRYRFRCRYSDGYRSAFSLL